MRLPCAVPRDSGQACPPYQMNSARWPSQAIAAEHQKSYTNPHRARCTILGRGPYTVRWQRHRTPYARACPCPSRSELVNDAKPRLAENLRSAPMFSALDDTALRDLLSNCQQLSPGSDQAAARRPAAPPPGRRSLNRGQTTNFLDDSPSRRGNGRMARVARIVAPGTPHLVTQRGRRPTPRAAKRAPSSRRPPRRSKRSKPTSR